MAPSKRSSRLGRRLIKASARVGLLIFAATVAGFSGTGGLGRASGTGPLIWAQDQPIKLKTTLVQVPVVVSDGGGRYVTDLQKDDFELFEDGVRQPIDFFKSVDEPFTVALLLDSSGSTSPHFNHIK